MRTARLSLDRPRHSDLAELFAIYSDPRVWTHYPSHRHTEPATTEVMLQRWIDGWANDGFGMWIVRTLDDSAMLGHCGCTVREGAFWNLGYRFAPAAQGQGYATETARVAVESATQHRPELPVVAFLLEHNVASATVASKVGLTLRHRASDSGNPDPDAMRLVYADRELTPNELAATLR